MRRDVADLRTFYAGRLGAAAGEMVRRKVVEAWGDAQGLDVLGLGYATPQLATFLGRARRAVAAMPGQQGVEVWPTDGGALSTLVDDEGLPFANALFDRVLLVHALEEAANAVAMLREVWRVLSPSGRVIVAAASRSGVWANAEATPFGHGQPYTRRQLDELLREADLEPVGWTRALYVPPVGWLAGWAEGFEQLGSRLWPPFAGVVLVEAVKQTFAVKARGVVARAPRLAGVLNPSPAGASPASQVLERGAERRSLSFFSGDVSHEDDHRDH